MARQQTLPAVEPKPKAPRLTQMNPYRVRAPSPDDLKAARERFSLTQAEAASYVYTTARRWREWEAGDHAMHAGLWELFLIRKEAVLLVEPETLAAFIEPIQ